MLENRFRPLIFSRKFDFLSYLRIIGIRYSSGSGNVKKMWKKDQKDVETAQTRAENREASQDISFLKAMSSKKSQLLELHKYNPMTVTPEKIKEWRQSSIKNFEIFKQRYIQERNDILGSDLAAAHFIVYRGGKVKFKNSDKWIEIKEDEDICEELPTKFVRNLYVECIDASSTKIRYEGLVNIANLKHLKSLILRNCPHVDDWFLDKISGEFADTLEHLDISDCSNVTENGLNGFYRFQKLKKLVVHNIVHNVNFEYRCFLLEDTLPGLVVDGVKFIEVK